MRPVKPRDIDNDSDKQDFLLIPRFPIADSAKYTMSDYEDLIVKYNRRSNSPTTPRTPQTSDEESSANGSAEDSDLEIIATKKEEQPRKRSPSDSDLESPVTCRRKIRNTRDDPAATFMRLGSQYVYPCMNKPRKTVYLLKTGNPDRTANLPSHDVGVRVTEAIWKQRVAKISQNEQFTLFQRLEWLIVEDLPDAKKILKKPIGDQRGRVLRALKRFVYLLTRTYDVHRVEMFASERLLFEALGSMENIQLLVGALKWSDQEGVNAHTMVNWAYEFCERR